MARRRIKRSAVSLEKLFAGQVSVDGNVEYRYSQLRLERSAQRQKPTTPRATASSFAQWVYGLYKRPSYLKRAKHDASEDGEDEDAKALGVFYENQIEDLRLWLNAGFPGSMSGNWTLDFVRPRAEETEALENSAPFEILLASSLRINGEPMRCVPDVALRHVHNGDVIIIERKVTGVPLEKVPLSGWPNLKAQLWVYSCIDRWRDAPNVYLLGQLWSRRVHPPELLPRYPRWKRSDAELQRECRRLFTMYGGEIEGENDA